MNIKETGLYNVKNKRFWAKGLTLALIVLALVIIPAISGVNQAMAEGEDEFFYLRTVRLEFDDNGNAAGLRPTSNNSFYIYYTSSNGSNYSNGWYTLYASGSNATLNWSNIKVRYFTINNTTSQNWQYYQYTGWHRDGESAVLTFKILDRIQELDITLNWSDNSNAAGFRPDPEQFEASLWLSNSATNGGNTALSYTAMTATDNGDDTWTLHFSGLDFQPSSSNNRYVWLTWKDSSESNQHYFNQYKTYNNVGYMYIDLMMSDYSVATLAHDDPTLHATITWEDAGNILGKRPTVDEFKPSLWLSNSNGTVTASNSQAVTIGENGYTITDNGDDTWSIEFTDVNVKKLYSQYSSYRYLWLTWEGSDYYVNQNLNTNYFGASNSDIANIDNIRWTVRSSALRVKINWQDNGNEYSLRPTIEEFKSSVKLLLSTTGSNATSASDVTGTDISVTDNGDNTWDVVFLDTTARKEQTSNNNKRYLFLTWSKDGSYANESVTFSQSGTSYLDLYNSSYNTGSAVLSYKQVPKYLVITLNWRDNGNEFNTRPDAAGFQPKLYISTSTSELTDANSKDVTGNNYEITENGNTWTILFKDTTARAEQAGSYRYLWLTWEGDGKYLNESREYYYSENSYPYLDLNSYSTPNLTYNALPSFVVAKINWADQGDAAGLRPRPDPAAFNATLHFSTSNSSIAGTTQMTTGDYTIQDNGNDIWTVVFWETELPYLIQGSSSTRYIWLTWNDEEKETQFYANNVTTNTYGYTYSSVSRSSNYGGQSRLSFTPKLKVIQFRLNWETGDQQNSDNNNFAQTRPLPENFKPHLWGSTSSSSATNAVDITGGDWSIAEYDDYWVITLKDADAGLFNGMYSYFWLTWEDTSLGTDEASQYYFNQAKTTSQHGYTYQSASNNSIAFRAWPKVFNITLSWKDNSNAAGLRPDPEDVTWHLWYNETNSSTAAGTTDLAGTDWKVVDNGNDTWTISFKNSDLLRKFYSGNSIIDVSRYLFITWEGSDYYINDVKNNTYGCIRFFTRFSYANNDSRFNGHANYWRQQKDTVDGIYPKSVVAILNWRDNGNAFGNRPSVDEFVPHLWWSTSSSDSTVSAAQEVTGNYEITDNGDDTWTIVFKDTDARTLTGINTRYLCLTWDGSDQYYNTARKTAEYGYTYDSLNYTKTAVNFNARQKPFQILLRWEDGDNKLGYRPSTSEFTPHVWRSNTGDGSKVEITGSNWTVKDNGDHTWTLSFPEPENLTDVAADQYYIRLTWDGSDQYYNRVQDTSFGYMREIFTNDSPYYVLTTRAKHRELPLELVWDDYSNGRNTRPDPTQFTPHLWYQASNYAGGYQNVWVEIEAERDVDYIINTDQDDQNKWVIRYLSIPYTYNREEDAGTTQTKISNYVLTWEGSDEYYNDIMTSGTYGYMSVAANSYSPSVTTRLKERSLDLKLNWSDFSNEGGYRPSIEDFKPQLYFGSATRTNVPIELEDGSWTITDNGDNTWLIHFDNVPYAVATNSGSTNTYGYYWLTWTGSDEYWNQRQSTTSSSSSYTTGCMYFSREASNPSVTTYLKTRERKIRLYWRDSEDANGWRPTPEYLKENMHLWTGANTVATEEIPMDSVEVIFDDTTNANYWDITLKHLPYYYDNNGYIARYSYYWLTWDGEHYINQVKTDVTPGSMMFSATDSSRTTVNCYPDEEEEFQLILYWDDSSNARGERPTPEQFTDLRLYYSTIDSGDVVGEIPGSDYEWEITDTRYYNSDNYWVIKITGLPRSIKNADGTETAIKYYWVNWDGKTDGYISKLQSYYYNGYMTSRFSNSVGSKSASVNIYRKYARSATVTINWNDNNNADGLRPTKDEFVPHLGYSGLGSANGEASRMIGTFENVPYVIDDSQDANNKWTVTFTDIPIVYTMDSGAERKVYYYWFVCDDIEGYNSLNPYNTAEYSRISNSISSVSYSSTYTLNANLKRKTSKDITVTLNWNDSSNEWGRRPSLSSFVPHLWAGTSTETKYEIPLTADQWEVTENGATSWKLKLKNVESLPAGNYWLTWDGSNDYYNQFTNSTRTGYLSWGYSTANPSLTIYRRWAGVILSWQDGNNADGKRPDPNSWVPTLYYGTSSGALEQIPLSPSDWHISSVNGNQWTIEFYHLPAQYTDSTGSLTNVPYYWLTFDPVDDYYYSDRTTSGYGEIKWQWAINTNNTLNVYTKSRPLTINLTFSDADGTVGERPEPIPESFGAHLWYGTSDEALGELEGLDYTITDNGNNTWTIVFDSVPVSYVNASGVETGIPCYWLTYDGGKYFLNNIKNTFTGTHGTMRSSKNSTNVYNMTTYCDYYRIGVNVVWTGTTNIANVTNAEIDRSHAVYDLVDTVTGEVLDTWEPDSPGSLSYTHTFYLPKYDENGEAVDHHRYTVVERGKPAVFELSRASRDYTSGIAGHEETITNTAMDKLYRFNFKFNDDNNALKLRPTTLQYLANEEGGNTYTYRSSVSISSTSSTFSSPIISLLGKDLMTGEELDYALEFTNLGKYYDIEYVERLDDDGIINLDYVFTLKTQPVTLQVAWDDEDNQENRRPSTVTEYLLANGVNMLSDNRLEFFPADAREDNPNIWEKTMLLPTVDADGNPITWSFKQAPQEALRYYHAEQANVQEPDFGGQTVTLTNILQDNWNYSVELYWVSFGKGSLPDKDYIDVRNRYDIYETVMPDDGMRKYKYELNISVNSAHYAVGDLEVRLPYYMQAVGDNGSTRWVAPLNPTNDISVPKAPGYNSRYSYNYWIDDHGTADLGDDEIVFTNWEEVANSSNTKLQVIYSLLPHEHLDTHIYELQAHATGYATLNYDDETHTGDREDVAEEQYSNTITFGLDNGLDITAFSKRQNEPQLLYYYNTSYINSNHLSREAFDTESFDYVAYYVYFTVQANQYATFSVSDLPGQNGEIVSVRHNGGSDYGLTVTGPTFSADKRVWTYTVDPRGSNNSTKYMYRSYWVTVAYPKSEGNIIMEDGRIFTRYTNEADIVAEALHPQNPDGKSPPPPDHNDDDAMNDATFIEWGDYRWKPSGKIFYYDKALQRNFNSSNTNTRPGGQTVLEYGGDIDASFNMVFYVNGDELMLDGVHEYYRFNITDNELWLHGTVSGGKTEYVKLEPDDYEIVAINASITAQRTDHTTGEKLPNVPLGRFVLQGQTNETGQAGGEWVNIATYTWPVGSTSLSQSNVFNVSGLAGRGITGYRIMTPRVNEYVRIDTSFTVRLKAESEKVKALLEHGEQLTQIEMLNIAAFPMEIEEPDGSWTMFTNIYRQYDGMVQPGVPSHTDNEAVRVGLYGHDADRLDYGNDVELIYDHALAQASPITSSVGSSKNTDSVVADSLTEIVKGVFTLNAYQTISNTTGIPLWLQHEIVIREGYYYDLLPEGWNFDPTASVIVKRYNGGAASLIGNPEIIDDYKGTNRQMIIFHVKAEGDAVNYTDSNSQGYSGLSITFGATISYEDNALYPRGYNIAVFQGVEYDENGNPMYDANGNYIPQVWELMHTDTTAYHDDGSFGESVYNVPRDDGLPVFNDINGDGITGQNDVLYMNSFVNPNYAKSVQTGVDKLIMGKSGVWQMHDVTDLDTDYYYHLSYRTTGQGTSRNVIVYDVLENAANTAGHKDEHFWKGTFKDIDVSYARSQGIDAQVYYSTATNLNENNNFSSKDSAGNPLPSNQIQMDIVNRPDLWIRYDSTAPKDRITAIAVDLRYKTDGSEMIFDGYDNSETYFVITMHSPGELPDDAEAILAYNRPCYQTILNSGGEDTARFNINDRVTIELHDLKTVTLKKVTRSDPMTDENGIAIMDEEGNFEYEQMDLGSVYFQLYKLTCTNANHTAVTNHSTPPATTSVTGSSTNSCWTRIAVGQTRSDGTVSFEDLESGTYAIREYSPYYYGSYSDNYAYVVPSKYRLENMWWSFEVDARSKNEPVLVYRGSTSYNSDSYKDFAFGTRDNEIIDLDDPAHTHTVWNVRTRQSLTIKKQWWPVGSDQDFGIERIKVNILRNGELYMKDIELTKAASWTATIRNLPVTSAYGTRYYYTIQETEETRAALEAFGFKVVVDNNSYDSLGGSATAGYTQERRLHNSTLDHLIVSKFVTEGGDRNKQYLFKLRMTNQENEVLNGSYDYIIYKLTENEDGTKTWVAGDHGTFRLDGDGSWGQMKLAHDERIIIEGLPVGTNYTITEIGADGYIQTTTKGKLSSKIVGSDENEDLQTPDATLNNEVAVTNTYQSEGRNRVTANKTINGRRPVYFTDNTFTYYLQQVAWHQEGAEEGAADAVTTYRLDGSTKRTIDFTANNGKGYSVSNSADGAITFPTLVWQTGESGYKGYRVYTVREEVDKERLGFELDKTVYVIWVDLEDDEAGTMKSTVTYYKTQLEEGQTQIDIQDRENPDKWEKLTSLSDLKFDNKYSAEGELRLRLTKTINGLAPEDGPFNRQRFSYTIYENDNDRPGQALQHLENNEQGIAEALLGTFTMDDVGNNQFFRYFLQEDALDETGTTIDSILYSITVQITDKGKGRLGAKMDIVYTKDGKRTTVPTLNVDLPLPVKEGEEPAEDYAEQLERLLSTLGQKLKFDNKYEAQGVWQAGIKKLVNGAEIDTGYYTNHSFTFTLSSVDGSGKETKIGEVNNGDEVAAVFDQVAYTADDINKTFTYVIHETGSSGSGITVNDTPWTVTLRVDDAGKGELTPVILSIKKSGEEVWNAESAAPMPEMTFEFDNTYEAKGTLTIDGTKELTGRPLKDEEFEFAIMDAQGNVVSTGTSDANGKITFKPIEYTQANENKHYEYKVYEVNNNLNGITYDDLAWKLAVDVADSGTGTLAVTYKLSKLETP